MNKMLFILVGVVSSSIAMDHTKTKELVGVDPVQLGFAQKFFPSVLGAHNNIENACAAYMKIVPKRPVINNISFADARRYACHHADAQSQIFIRYSNEFMRRIYNSYMNPERAILDIENDKKLMQTILTGESRVYTQQELLKIKDSFKEAVRNYAKKQ